MKLFMKQYWRVGQIRALLSLAMSMFVLGRAYYVYIPGLVDFGLYGALILGTVLVIFFMGLGWIYDAKTNMWSPKRQAAVERSPYRYVPDFRNIAIDYPILVSFISVFKKTFEKLNLSTKPFDDLLFYLDDYFKARPNKPAIRKLEKESAKYMEEHPFVEGSDAEFGSVSLVQKGKLKFEIEMLRIRWIQSLTGLVQDMLVFAATYGILLAPVLFPDSAVDDYIVIGLISIALPLLIFLLFIGWVYDKKMTAWRADAAVKVERNPYSYVADPRYFAMIFPFFYAFLVVIEQVYDNMGFNSGEIRKAIDFIVDYGKTNKDTEIGMAEAKRLRKEYGRVFSSRTEEVT